MERKLIIIKKNDIRNLSFNEVFNMYQALIKKKASKWATRYEFEDMVQIASIALWRAYESYDSSKTVGFGSLAQVCIERALLRHEQLNKPKTENPTSKIKFIVSMDEKIYTNSKGQEITIQDFLSSEDSFPDQISERIILKKVISNLNEKQKRHLSLILQGYSTGELAEAENIKRTAMSARRTVLVHKLRDLYRRATAAPTIAI